MYSKTKVICLILIIFLTVVFTIGCNKAPEITESKEKNNVSESYFPLTLTDQIGREVTIETQPERIISLSPANTEILYALGLEDKIVGVTDYCDYPEAVTTKEKIGGYEDPNIEKNHIPKAGFNIFYRYISKTCGRTGKIGSSISCH